MHLKQGARRKPAPPPRNRPPPLRTFSHGFFNISMEGFLLPIKGRCPPSSVDILIEEMKRANRTLKIRDFSFFFFLFYLFVLFFSKKIFMF